MTETRADQVAKDIADNICDLADRVSGSLDRIMISAGCLQDILALRLKPLLDTAPSSEHCAINGCVHKEHGCPTWPAGSNPFKPEPQTTPTHDEAVSPREMAAHILRIAIEDRRASDTVEMNVGDLSGVLRLLLSAAPAPASGGVEAVAVKEGARQIYEKYRARGFVEDGDETAPWDDAQPSIQRAFVELANLRAIVHATGEARDAAGYLGSAEDCIRQLSADAEAWHRICDTIATVLDLPLPEADFANVVRDWSERQSSGLSEIEAMLSDGQGDDDGPPILPDFEPGWSTVAKVEACLQLLEKRRDALMERDEP